MPVAEADLERIAQHLFGAVPPLVRETAQHELRDLGRGPYEAARLEGPACKAAHGLLVAAIEALQDVDRPALARFLLDAPGLAFADASNAARHALVRVLQRDFHNPRAILDADQTRTGRAFDAVPSLRAACDDDGLVPLSWFATDDRTNDWLRKGDVYLHYHPFLRRFFNAGVNTDFTALLRTAAEMPGLDVRVAIDPIRFSRVSPGHRMELDHWFGPKLTRDTLDDHHSLGVTAHWRAPGLESYWGWPLVSTEFWWTGDVTEHQKWLQVEELSPGPEDQITHSLAHGYGVGRSREFTLNRYLHSARDTLSKAFTHLDGAVRAYDPDSYSRRRATTIDRAGKAARYRKLFRVDGPIPEDLWYQLVVMFYRQNEMVGEYLSDGFQQATAERNGWPQDVRAKLAGGSARTKRPKKPKSHQQKKH